MAVKRLSQSDRTVGIFSFFGAAALLLTLSAEAALASPFYSCRIVAEAKRGFSPQREYTLALFEDRSNQVDIYFPSLPKTTLEVRVGPTGKIEGLVNGQANFILAGNFEDALFESASAKGSIQCEREQNPAAIFYFAPWRRWYHPEQDSLLRTVELSKFRHTCFEGEIEEAARLVLESRFNSWASKILRIEANKRLVATKMEPECIISGTNPDEGCIKWGEPIEQEYSIGRCEFGEESRP